MFVDRNDNSVRGQCQLARDGLDDTDVGLMRHQPVEVRLPQRSDFRRPLALRVSSMLLHRVVTATLNSSVPCIFR